MQWTGEAEAALSKVPFFVRKKVRARVEEEAAAAGRPQVTLDALQESQRRFLAGMSAEVRGYRVETCFGAGGCPNRATADDSLPSRIEERLRSAELLALLRQRVAGPLRFHHEFRVTLADCPNACSQPQIRDVGLIGALLPQRTEAPCSACGACMDACPEAALQPDSGGGAPRLDAARCLGCGRCVALCPSGSLAPGARGYRVLLGGKLGRHPRLARELPGIYTADQVLSILEGCLAIYKDRSHHGERFAEIVTPDDCDALAGRCGG
jgi:dissimilatory sulfite reductase (desulfoviridin) alpha/beta subunit